MLLICSATSVIVLIFLKYRAVFGWVHLAIKSSSWFPLECFVSLWHLIPSDWVAYARAALLGMQSHCVPWGTAPAWLWCPSPCSWLGCLLLQPSMERSVGSSHSFAPASGSLTSHPAAVLCPLSCSCELGFPWSNSHFPCCLFPF